MGDVTPAREALEVAICEALGKAWRMYGAHLTADRSGRGVPLEYPEVRAEAEKVLGAAEAWAADEVLKTADMTLARAREAEGRLAAAEGRLADAREGTGKFLAQYGDGSPVVFKVAIDLANSLAKVLGGVAAGDD